MTFQIPPPFDMKTKQLFMLSRSDQLWDKSILSEADVGKAKIVEAKNAMTARATAKPLEAASLQPHIDTLNQYASGSGPMDSLKNHASNHFDNMQKNMNLYASHTNLVQSLTSSEAGDALSDFCSNINDFFSSIMGKGAEFIASIISKITELLEAILSPILEGIEAIMSAISEVVTAITDMIAKEIAALVQAISDLLEWAGLANLAALFNHPCVQTLITTAGTTALIATLV